MNIDKAIKILTINNDHNPDFTDAERRDALKLGIEALKIKLEDRRYGNTPATILLPGETEE